MVFPATYVVSSFVPWIRPTVMRSFIIAPPAWRTRALRKLSSAKAPMYDTSCDGMAKRGLVTAPYSIGGSFGGS